MFRQVVQAVEVVEEQLTYLVATHQQVSNQ
jgi:hypothetical protein